MSKINTALFIRQLELRVNLGWRSAERRIDQPVVVDIDVQFPEPPAACVTDELAETSCYADLIEEIRAKLAVKHYKLVEHLSLDIYELAKTHLPPQSRCLVRVTKFPKIEGLNGGVSFQYGDDGGSAG